MLEQLYKQKGLATRNKHLQYEHHIFSGSKEMARVKDFQIYVGQKSKSRSQGKNFWYRHKGLATRNNYRLYSLNIAKYARLSSLSGTTNRACEVRFHSKTEGGPYSPYSVYNLFITYFTTKFTFCKLSYCNLNHLKCSTLS